MKTKKQTYLGVLIGIIVLIIGNLFSIKALLLLSHLIVIYSCYSYALIKGYKSILGVILGLFLNALGFLILAILPDKLKNKE